MGDETLLLNPGPVVLHQSVREALASGMISHRSEAFEELYKSVRSGVRQIYTHSRHDNTPSQWDGEVFFLNATATLGMDAAIANFTDPDDTVLALVNGHFGSRFAQIAGRQCNVDRYEIPWGESFDVDAVSEQIFEKDYELVTMIHTETSTGLRNPIGAVGEAVGKTDGLFVVDGVSSIGGERIHPHEWGIDVSIVDAQKALAASPGVCAMFLSEKALSRLDDDQSYFYADLHRHRMRARDENQTPFTSAVSLFYGLEASVERITDIGVDTWLSAHEHRAHAWEAAVTAMGLELFGSPTGQTAFANTVTAIDFPEVVKTDPEPFFATLRDHDVFVGGGHSQLSGDIFRLGTMGDLEQAAMERGLTAIGDGLESAGATVDTESGLAELASVLDS